jgi:hypothetical protein
MKNSILVNSNAFQKISVNGTFYLNKCKLYSYFKDALSGDVWQLRTIVDRESNFNA